MIDIGNVRLGQNSVVEIRDLPPMYLALYVRLEATCLPKTLWKETGEQKLSELARRASKKII